MDSSDDMRACSCWQLPMPSGTAPLAVLAQSRRVRLSLKDGSELEGELDWVFWRRAGRVDTVLELTDERGVTLVDRDEVSMVTVLSPPLRPHNVLRIVLALIENWRDLPRHEQRYLDLIVGDHELLEVTVKRTRLTCLPSGEG